jgi:hypothetical protein
MHPDLYLVVYRQQERELADRLEHERSQGTRPDAATRRATPHRGAAHRRLLAAPAPHRQR